MVVLAPVRLTVPAVASRGLSELLGVTGCLRIALGYAMCSIPCGIETQGCMRSS